VKKPYEHECLECGNVYYYRKLKRNGRCPVCHGALMPKGYKYINFLGSTHLVKNPPPPHGNKILS